MALKYNINVVGPTTDNPIKGNDWRGNLKRLSDVFKALAGGQRVGGYTVKARTSGVCAAATATMAAVTTGTVTVNGTTLTATQKNSRATATCAAVAAADTITVNGELFTSAKRNASSTAACATVLAGDTVTVGVTIFTGVAGAATLGAATFSVDTGDTATGASLATQINAHAVTSLLVSASSTTGTVTIRALLGGTAGNAIVLSSVGGTVTCSGSGFLAGGTATTTTSFDAAIAGFNTKVAESLVTAINANAVTSLIVIASNALGVVTIRSLIPGTAGDAYTLTSSNGTRLAVTGSGFLAGGAALTNNTFDFSANNTTTAAALAAAINASTTSLVSGHVIATSALAVTTLTAIVPGIAGNAVTLASSDGTTMAVTGSGRLIGGTETLVTMTF